MKAAHPYLNFPGNAEQAFAFYRSAFGGEFQSLLRYRDFGDNAMGVGESELDKIAHVSLPLCPHTTLMGTDAVASHGRVLTVGNNFSITLDPDTADEADRLFEALSDGGRVDMPLGKTEWAEKYGMCTDKFGVQWMVNYAGSVQFGQRAPGAAGARPPGPPGRDGHREGKVPSRAVHTRARHVERIERDRWPVFIARTEP